MLWIKKLTIRYCLDIFPQARPLQVACEEVRSARMGYVTHLSLLVRRNGVYARQVLLEVFKNATQPAWSNVAEVVRNDVHTRAPIETVLLLPHKAVDVGKGYDIQV